MLSIPSENFYQVPTPMGTALIGSGACIELDSRLQISSYAAPNGARVWLEHGECMEFQKPVILKQIKHAPQDIRIDVISMHGEVLSSFVAVAVFAITPVRGEQSMMKMALAQTFRARTIH